MVRREPSEENLTAFVESLQLIEELETGSDRQLITVKRSSARFLSITSETINLRPQGAATFEIATGLGDRRREFEFFKLMTALLESRPDIGALNGSQRALHLAST